MGTYSQQLKQMETFFQFIIIKNKNKLVPLEILDYPFLVTAQNHVLEIYLVCRAKSGKVGTFKGGNSAGDLRAKTKIISQYLRKEVYQTDIKVIETLKSEEQFLTEVYFHTRFS